MESVDLEVLRTARRWLRQGHEATLVVVARTWGSAPRPPGALMVIRDDGQVVGSVSGGCIEDDLVANHRAWLADLQRPERRSYGVAREQAERFGLPCGGTLELVLEPLRPGGSNGWLDDVLAAIEGHRCVVRDLDLRTGASHVRPATHGEVLCMQGERLRTVHGPRWRLLLIGAGQLSRCLAEMARALDYEVAVCDPRTEYALAWAVPHAALHRDYPDDFVTRLRPDAHTAVVALTHDPKLDDAALIEALGSPAFYVGALGSRRNNEARRERLAQFFDLTPTDIARLHGPVGLPIGSRTPPEIAVAILAELTAVRHGAALVRVDQGAAVNTRVPAAVVAGVPAGGAHGPAARPVAACGIDP